MGLSYSLNLQKSCYVNTRIKSFLGPFCTYLLTVLVGTGHSVYPLLPVIYDVSIKKVFALNAQWQWLRSPHKWGSPRVHRRCGSRRDGHRSKNDLDISLVHVLMVTIPATFCGLMAGCTWSLFRGKELDQDDAFIERCKTQISKRPSLMKPLKIPTILPMLKSENRLNRVLSRYCSGGVCRDVW